MSLSDQVKAFLEASRIYKATKRGELVSVSTILTDSAGAGAATKKTFCLLDASFQYKTAAEELLEQIAIQLDQVYAKRDEYIRTALKPASLRKATHVADLTRINDELRIMIDALRPVDEACVHELAGVYNNIPEVYLGYEEVNPAYRGVCDRDFITQDFCRHVSCLLDITSAFEAAELAKPMTKKLVDYIPVEREYYACTSGYGAGALSRDHGRRVYQGVNMRESVQSLYIQLMSEKEAEAEFKSLCELNRGERAHPKFKHKLTLYLAKLYLEKIRPEGSKTQVRRFSVVFGGHDVASKRAAVKAAVIALNDDGKIPPESRRVLNQGRTKDIFCR